MSIRNTLNIAREASHAFLETLNHEPETGVMVVILNQKRFDSINTIRVRKARANYGMWFEFRFLRLFSFCFFPASPPPPPPPPSPNRFLCKPLFSFLSNPTFAQDYCTVRDLTPPRFVLVRRRTATMEVLIRMHLVLGSRILKAIMTPDQIRSETPELWPSRFFCIQEFRF